MITRLPYVANEQGITGQSDTVSRFIAAWMEALGSRAQIMRQDARLMQCAADHALYLSQRTGDELLQSMHRGRNGSYSNDRVLDAGYKLPSEYRRGHNNVESCARDGRGPQMALQGLLNSNSHRAHLLGSVGFSDRTVYGVGQSGDDYVVVICPPEP